MMPMPDSPPRLIRLAEVKKLTSLGSSMIYKLIAESDFPKQIPLGSKTVAWDQGEVIEWINRRKAERAA